MPPIMALASKTNLHDRKCASVACLNLRTEQHRGQELPTRAVKGKSRRK